MQPFPRIQRALSHTNRVSTDSFADVEPMPSGLSRDRLETLRLPKTRKQTQKYEAIMGNNTCDTNTGNRLPSASMHGFKTTCHFPEGLETKDSPVWCRFEGKPGAPKNRNAHGPKRDHHANCWRNESPSAWPTPPPECD